MSLLNKKCTKPKQCSYLVKVLAALAFLLAAIFLKLTRTGTLIYIKTKTQAGCTNTYNYSNNQMLNSISGVKNYSFFYDNYGNVTYNDAGQLITASGGGITKSFAYDALGNRVKVTTNGSTNIEIFNDANRLLLVKEASGTIVQKVYLGTRLIAQKRGNTRKFLHFEN